MRDGHARLAADIRKAHRFDLSEPFAAAADEIMRSTPTSIVKAFPLARLPYRLCWMETAYAARSAFVHGQDMGEMYRKDISRIGVLLQAQDDSGLRWRCHLGWSFRTGQCSLSLYGMDVDLRDDAPPPPFPAVTGDIYMDGHRSRADADALAAIANRVVPFASPYYREFLASLPDTPAVRQKFEAMAFGDWSGEQEYWITAVALMNGRNVARIEPGPDMAKLSKARRKQGKPELLDYSVCKIAPRILARIGGRTGGEGGNVRAHFVRGHFKVRESGIHWWSPHVRGDASAGFVGKRYEVA